MDFDLFLAAAAISLLASREIIDFVVKEMSR